MELIADGLLTLGALVASVYCIVLSRRLRKMSLLEDGVGQAIMSLSAQVDEMRSALGEAKTSTAAAAHDLEARVGKASAASEKLEQLMRTTERQTGLLRGMLEAAARVEETRLSEETTPKSFVEPGPQPVQAEVPPAAPQPAPSPPPPVAQAPAPEPTPVAQAVPDRRGAPEAVSPQAAPVAASVENAPLQPAPPAPPSPPETTPEPIPETVETAPPVEAAPEAAAPAAEPPAPSANAPEAPAPAPVPEPPASAPAPAPQAATSAQPEMPVAAAAHPQAQQNMAEVGAHQTSPAPNETAQNAAAAPDIAALPASTPTEAEIQQSPAADVAETIGRLLSVRDTDDDEMFAKRLIAALSPRGAETGVSKQ